MKWARVSGFVTTFVTTQLRTTVRAGIDHGIEFASFIAGNQHRLAADVGGVKIVVIGDLAFMGQIHPIAFKYVFHFQIKQGLIGKHGAV